MNFLPNKEQILSFVRSIVIALAMYAVGKGWVSENLALEIATFVVGLLAAAWGVADKTKAALVTKAADIVPISKSSQEAVGITKPQMVPTSPKV